MDMGDVPGWIQAIAAAVLLIAGGWAFVRREIAAVRADAKSWVDLERSERKADVDRIDTELAGMAEIRQAVTKLEGTVNTAFEKVAGGQAVVAEQVHGLSTRLEDFKQSNDRANDEIRDSVRELRNRVGPV